MASALYVAFVRFQALSDTHCTYTCRDGQAKLTWVVGYVQK